MLIVYKGGASKEFQNNQLLISRSLLKSIAR